MATTWKVTADSVPVLDGWGWAEYWPLATWVEWHQTLKAKYGKEQANKTFIKYWNEQSEDAGPLNRRNFDFSFRQYARENGFFDEIYSGLGVISKPLGWLTDLFTTADKVEGKATGAIQDTASGIGTSGKILKYAIPAAVIIILVMGAFYLYNQAKR